MMAKIFLPLLLIVSAVAGDDINDICEQLVTQVNLLQNLLPIEIDVKFPMASTSLISGSAKYKLVSPLMLPKNGCSVNNIGSSNKRRVTIELSSERSYVISPKRIFTVYTSRYILELDVEPSETGATKTVTVFDFSIENNKIVESPTEIPLPFKNFINANLKSSLKSKLQYKLNSTFKEGERVEINGRLAEDLMLNVFQAIAQDF